MTQRVPQQLWWTWMCVSLVLVVLSNLGTNVYAQEVEEPVKIGIGQGIKLGPLVLHPGFTSEVIYDDNIFLRQDNRVSDTITRLTPTLNFELLPLTAISGRIKLNLGYTPALSLFGSNTNENFTNHTVTAGLLYDGPAGLKMGLNERYVITSDPSSSETQSATAARTPRRQNDIGLTVGYSVNPRVDLELGYVRTDQTFVRDANKNLNRNENTGTVTFFYHFLPKTAALMAYSFKRTDFTDLLPTDINKDNGAHNVSLGLRFDPTAKVRGTLKVGYTIKVFDANTQPDGRPLDNEQTISMATDLTWAVTERTQVLLLASRNIEESSTVGASSFTATRFELGLDQRFVIEALSASIRGSYERDDFNNLERRDNIWRTSVTMRYAVLRWLRLSVGYEFARKFSDDPAPTSEYAGNRFLFGATGQF